MTKTCEYIQILSALATDIVSGFAQTQNEKNKHIPMSKAFPSVFDKQKYQLTAEQQETQTAVAWLTFLEKTELIPSGGD